MISPEEIALVFIDMPSSKMPGDSLYSEGYRAGWQAAWELAKNRIIALLNVEVKNVEVKLEHQRVDVLTTGILDESKALPTL